MADRKLIMICDDQRLIHETLGVYLENEGFAVTSAYDGDEALAAMDNIKPDLIVLDIMMPKKSGIEVCRTIRAENNNLPIIMLTAKSEEIDMILGLELGADDYIVKPFSAREVVARIKTVLRRYREQQKAPHETLHFHGLDINIMNYDIKVNGVSIKLTPKEVEIFHLLASSPGRVFSREQILEQVWGADYVGDERAVDTQIKRIRQKLPENCDMWEIKTIYGIGYKFEVFV